MTTLRLTGPGIETDCRVRVAGIAGCVLDYLIQRPDPFPLGMDVILIEDKRLMCIPRTTTVEIC
ncbi:phosphonate C-P lyase system protein PhnH [Vibrio sp. PP-XX7]